MRRGLLFAALLLSACSGDDDDATPTPTPTPPTTAVVSGTTIDYFSLAAVPSVSLTTTGLAPEIADSSDGAGTYSFEVPVGSAFNVRAEIPSHRPTSSERIVVQSSSHTATLALVTSVDYGRQYSSVGIPPALGASGIFLDLRDPAGAPIEGVPLADIALLTTAGAPAAGVAGPFFFGAAGDMVDNGTLSTSTAYDGRARAGFLAVPPGSYTLRVVYGAGPTTRDVPVSTEVDGVALRRTYP